MASNISFDEQVSFYKTVFDKVGDKSICFRTPDIGGDKVTVDMAFHNAMSIILQWVFVLYVSHGTPCSAAHPNTCAYCCC